MSKVPRWLFVFVALVAVVVALRFTVFAPEPIEVTVSAVERGVVEDSVTNTRAGTVKARLRARLSPQLGGLVTEVPHREGESVAAGALLLRLEDSVQQAQLSLAQKDVHTAKARADEACLSFDLAEKELVRGTALSRDGITSDQALDSLTSVRDRAAAGCAAVRAVLEQSRAQVRVAEAQLALTVVRAPFAGVVADLSTEIGEWITPAPPGVPIPPVLDLLAPSSLYVSAPIDEIDSERIEVGQEVRLSVDSRPGEHFSGHLVRVAAYVLDQLEQNRTVEVEAAFDDPEVAASVLPGTSADVEVILARRTDVLRVPTAAIGEGGKVLVLADGRLVERTVAGGLRNWQFTEALEGVAEGDQVVTLRDSTDIKPGARAVVRPRS